MVSVDVSQTLRFVNVEFLQALHVVNVDVLARSVCVVLVCAPASLHTALPKRTRLKRPSRSQRPVLRDFVVGGSGAATCIHIYMHINLYTLI